MAPSAIATELPPSSSLQDTLNDSKPALRSSPHPAYLHHLATTVLYNLQNQHDWTSLFIHTHSSDDGILPRLIISGLPPRRAYIHPDEQVAILKAEHDTGEAIEQISEHEWVLPTHWEEKWSLAKIAAVFDTLDRVPPHESLKEDEDAPGYKWHGKNRQKRLLLATVHDDSTVIYYIMHDGIVKPRQN